MIEFLSLQNTTDTIKLGLPFHKLGVNMDSVISKSIESVYHKSGGIKSYICHKPIHGFNYIKVTPETDQTLIQLSAKILGDNYRDGINITNMDVVADAMNSTKLLTVNPDILFDSSVYRIDPNQTIELSENPKVAVEALSILTARGYNFTPYLTGIDMKRMAKSRKDRMVCYSKRTELLLAENKEFVKDNPTVMASFTDNSFRMETPIQQLSLMRSVYGINEKEFNLKDLLQADVNPIHQMFEVVTKEYNKVLSRINQLASMENNKSKGRRLVMNMVKDMALIELCDYDLNVIMSVHKKHISGNLSSYKKKYRELIGLMKAKDGIKEGHDTIIHEIGQKLSEAV